MGTYGRPCIYGVNTFSGYHAHFIMLAFSYLYGVATFFLEEVPVDTYYMQWLLDHRAYARVRLKIVSLTANSLLATVSDVLLLDKFAWPRCFADF